MNGSRFVVLASLFVFTFGFRFGVRAFEVQGSDSRFDVVSVKENTGADLSIRFDEQPPDGFRRTNLPLDSYVAYAYGIRQWTRLEGLPDWARSARFDIAAKAAVRSRRTSGS